MSAAKPEYAAALNKVKRTPWYPWGIWPARVGWYEMRGRMLDEGTMMFWNGHQFGYWVPHPNCTQCSQMWVHWADDESDQWRGLTRSFT